LNPTLTGLDLYGGSSVSFNAMSGGAKVSMNLLPLDLAYASLTYLVEDPEDTQARCLGDPRNKQTIWDDINS
jgi:hypothetical protein